MASVRIGNIYSSSLQLTLRKACVEMTGIVSSVSESYTGGGAVTDMIGIQTGSACKNTYTRRYSCPIYVGILVNIFINRGIAIIFIQHPRRGQCREKHYSYSVTWVWWKFCFFFRNPQKVFLIHYKGKSWGIHSLKLKETGKETIERKHPLGEIIAHLVICELDLECVPPCFPDWGRSSKVVGMFLQTAWCWQRRALVLCSRYHMLSYWYLIKYLVNFCWLNKSACGQVDPGVQQRWMTNEVVCSLGGQTKEAVVF